jgi:hypothetical protein
MRVIAAEWVCVCACEGGEGEEEEEGDSGCGWGWVSLCVCVCVWLAMTISRASTGWRRRVGGSSPCKMLRLIPTTANSVKHSSRFDDDDEGKEEEEGAAAIGCACVLPAAVVTGVPARLLPLEVLP